MVDWKAESSEPGYSPLTRRERLERIASAERDRRAGRREVAIATIGEPLEWPARAVLALALLSEEDNQSRRLLEEGLDLWARDAGLAELDPVAPNEVEEPESDPLGFDLEAHPLDADPLDSHPKEPELEAPLGLDELDRAFAEAETDVDSMHNVNEVAERVLFDEPVSFDGLSEHELTPVDAEDVAWTRREADDLGMDAAYVAPSVAPSFTSSAAGEDSVSGATDVADPRHVILATLESWLNNLQSRKGGRPQ